MDVQYYERLRLPRSIVVRFPYGRPFGREHEPDNQRVVLEHCLRLLESARGPTVEPLPYRWRREDWTAVLASLHSR